MARPQFTTGDRVRVITAAHPHKQHVGITREIIPAPDTSGHLVYAIQVADAEATTATILVVDTPRILLVEYATGERQTSYDPNTLQGNADLGAKFLAWLSCFYSYWGDNGGTSVSNPGQYTMAWYYHQAGLNYPDTTTPSGAPNPNSLCTAVFNNPNNPEYAALPSTTAQPWSCPYSATAGDPTLLDFTLSAHNEGSGYTDQYGIQNWWYVNGVEGFIPQFASGALP